GFDKIWKQGGDTLTGLQDTMRGGTDKLLNADTAGLLVDAQNQGNKTNDAQLAAALEMAKAIQKRELKPTDAIEQLFAPWMTHLIHGIDIIANSKIISGVFGSDTEDLTKSFEQ